LRMENVFTVMNLEFRNCLMEDSDHVVVQKGGENRVRKQSLQVINATNQLIVYSS